MSSFLISDMCSSYIVLLFLGLGAGETRTHCGGNIADAIMFH